MVTVPGTSTSWAVGWSYDSNVAAYRTLTERSTGGAWSIVSSPNPSGSGYSQLNRVDATSTSNVWAIGYDTQTGSLVERFDGTRWTTVPAPAGISLRALDVVSSTEVWVAGYNGSSAAVARWNGSAWATVYTQPVANRHLTVFEGIAVGPGGHVWAVGYYNSPSSGLYEPLLVHWTGNGGAGTLATAQPSPPLTVSGLASGVTATSAGNLWAAGYTSPPGAGNATLILKGTGG